MPSPENHAAEPPKPPFDRLRRLAAGLLALIVFSAAIYTTVRRSAEDLTLVFRDAPLHIVPEGHVAQVQIVRTYIPKGAKLLYFMDKPEAWQFGLWQRSLYPDYTLIASREASGASSPELNSLRARLHIRFALSAGSPPPTAPFIWKISLPDYPNGIPVVFGKIQE